MIARITGILLFILSASIPLSASHHEHEVYAPEEEAVGFSPGGSFAMMMDLGDFDIYANAEGFLNEPDIYKALRFGGYYRLHRNLKIGLFYCLQAGVRHDDDWISLPGDEWGWADSSLRWEHLLTADVSPRFLLDFLPGKNWLLTARARYSYNFFNNHQKVLLRPDLTWFFILNREPVFNVSAGYGMYFPINFGGSFIYQQGPYLGFIYHLTDLIKIELAGEWSRTTWSSSAESLEEGLSYSLDTQEIRLNLGLILKPQL